MQRNILITGGTGLIGKRLAELLLNKGYHVGILSRQRKQGKEVRYFEWDPKNGYIDPDAIAWAHGIVHLAGANVADGRWTDARKREIIESRALSTDVLRKALANNSHQVGSFIAATAIGWYGNTGNTLVDETIPAGDGFLASVCKEWEMAVDSLVATGVRVAKIRVGVVLSHLGGAYQEMAKPVKFMAGAPLGSGRQYMSWVHLDDICNMFIFALENDQMQGAYNGVSPHPATNAELTRAIAKHLDRPLLLPNVPEFALRLMLGEMADIVLDGCKVSCRRIQDAGFQFQYDNLDKALSSFPV